MTLAKRPLPNILRSSTEGGHLERYPESQRPFSQLDSEEQSLALLYRESATWGIGHGCAAGWDCEPGQEPPVLYADVMPASSNAEYDSRHHGRSW